MSTEQSSIAALVEHVREAVREDLEASRDTDYTARDYGQMIATSLLAFGVMFRGTCHVLGYCQHTNAQPDDVEYRAEAQCAVRDEKSSWVDSQGRWYSFLLAVMLFAGWWSMIDPSANLAVAALLVGNWSFLAADPVLGMYNNTTNN